MGVSTLNIIKETNMKLSYQNNLDLKTAFVKEVKKHRKADEILQGTYGEMQNGKWRGCSVACANRSLAILNGEKLVESYGYHRNLAIKLFGSESMEWLARLQDTIFEGLPKKEAMLWTEQFAKAIPVGVDLTKVKWQFCAFILKENIDRVLKLKISDELKEQVVKAIRGSLALQENAIKTGNWDGLSAWSAAWSAESAARSAESAARSAAWSAWSAAWSVESAARSVESAARSAAWSVESKARSAAYIKYATKLLQLLKACK
jgi:hypothetical protein